jgi:SAM-dependent methyltransferase
MGIDKTTSSSYLLAGGSAELERLRFQARVWEPEAELMLDRIGVAPGWRCVDLGCGAMGVLGPLSRCVGPQGHVLGVDIDAKLLGAAREYIHDQRLTNVELLELDAYHSQLPRESFDFTHVRFVFGPVGRDQELLHEMLALTRPGGLLAIQEPDCVSWNCYPPNAGWATLKAAIEGAFARAGGDINAGQRTFGLLRGAGLEDVQVRAAVVALQDQHPYKRLPVQFAASLRGRILDSGLLSESELDAAVAECERVAADPQTIVISMVVTQVWGRKPKAWQAAKA